MYLLYVCVQQMIRATPPNCDRSDKTVVNDKVALISDPASWLKEIKDNNDSYLQQCLQRVMPVVQKHMSKEEINFSNNQVKEFAEAVKGYNGTDRTKFEAEVANVVFSFTKWIFTGSRDERAVIESMIDTFAAIDKICTEFALVKTENDDSNKLRQSVQLD